MDKCHVLPEQVCQILPNGEKIGSYKPTSEWKMHYNAYLLLFLFVSHRYSIRSEIGAIVHTHSPSLLTFALSHKTPETHIFPLISQFLGEVAMVSYHICGSDKLVVLGFGFYIGGCVLQRSSKPSKCKLLHSRESWSDRRRENYRGSV